MGDDGNNDGDGEIRTLSFCVHTRSDDEENIDLAAAANRDHSTLNVILQNVQGTKSVKKAKELFEARYLVPVDHQQWYPYKGAPELSNIKTLSQQNIKLGMILVHTKAKVKTHLPGDLIWVETLLPWEAYLPNGAFTKSAAGQELRQQIQEKEQARIRKAKYREESKMSNFEAMIGVLIIIIFAITAATLTLGFPVL